MAVPWTGHTRGLKRARVVGGVWELPPGAMRFVDPGLGTVQDGRESRTAGTGLLLACFP